MKIAGSILIALAVMAGCKKQDTAITAAPVPIVVAPPVNKTADTTVTYLALGDSYTIGQSVIYTQSFPFQLASQLRNNKYDVTDPVIIAQTGWTTADLKRSVSNAAITKKFSFVTLLIGVNNQFQNGDTAKYRTDFNELVNTSILYANGLRNHVFVLSVPDWSVTPFASTSGRNTTTINAQINAYNAISESKRLGVNYLNITGISREAKTNNALLADDGLHPSGLMYLKWVKELLPLVLPQLKK